MFACVRSGYLYARADDVLTVVNRPVEKADAWNTEGLKMLSQGQVGVLLLAGGQGTRLGSTAPNVKAIKLQHLHVPAYRSTADYWSSWAYVLGAEGVCLGYLGTATITTLLQ